MVHMFPKLEDKRLAEFTGIILGDGSINRTYQNRVQITLNKREVSYRCYIVRMIRGLFNVNPDVYFRNKENAVDIRIFRKEIVDFLIDELGLVESPKWNRQVVPDIFLGNHLEKFVLRGYFDTDGSVVITNNNGTVYPRLEMKVCPSPMKKSFVDILERLNFRFGCYTIENSRFRIQMNGRVQAYKWLRDVGIRTQYNIKGSER